MPLPKKQNRFRRPTKVKRVSVMDRITSIDYSDDDGINLLLYGQSGTGKTTLWATFPAPILAILCSGGKKSGELRSVDTPANRKRIKTVTLQSTEDMEELLANLERDNPYKTVVLDHGSGFQDLTIKEILGLDEAPQQKNWGLVKQEQWGESTTMCKKYFKKLLDLGSNSVIIAQERGFNERSDGEILAPSIGAAMTPALTTWLNANCDYITQTFKRARMIATTRTTGVGKKRKEITIMERGEGIEYCLRLEPHDVFTTKFRVPKGSVYIPAILVDPDYDKILSVLKGEYEEPRKPVKPVKANIPSNRPRR